VTQARVTKEKSTRKKKKIFDKKKKNMEKNGK